MFITKELYVETFILHKWVFSSRYFIDDDSSSVADTFHFDVDPDPRVNILKKWIRIRVPNFDYEFSSLP